MKTISTKKTLWLVVTALLTMGAVLVTILSLKNGYLEIFPYFYLLPVLLLAWFYPRYSIYFTVLLGWVFLWLIWLYGPADIRIYTSGIAFFYVFVSLGTVFSALSGQLVQERKFREIVENSQAGIFTFDRETFEVREANGIAAAILGFPSDELRTQRFPALLMDNLQEIRFFRALRQDGRIVDMELALRRKDQVIIWVLITASITRDDVVICSIVDISSSKRLKDELIESDLRYRLLFEGASDAIILHDVDGKIFETNIIATRYIGYSKKEFMQMRLHDLDLYPERLFTAEVAQQFRSRGHILFRTRFRTKSGEVMNVEVSSRMTEYFGMVVVMSTVRDIAELQDFNA